LQWLLETKFFATFFRISNFPKKTISPALLWHTMADTALVRSAVQKRIESEPHVVLALAVDFSNGEYSADSMILVPTRVYHAWANGPDVMITVSSSDDEESVYLHDLLRRAIVYETPGFVNEFAAKGYDIWENGTITYGNTDFISLIEKALGTVNFATSPVPPL
jgi:hypothetical protein